MIDGKNTCPKCGPVDPVLDQQVKVWQRANGIWDGHTFTASDYKTLYDSEDILVEEVVCPLCSHTFSKDHFEVVWS
jgi:ribosomal protein S27AE